MESYHVIGHFGRLPDGALEGWCWSPDRPGDRLTVEIVADDTPIGTVRADAYCVDLVPRRVGDGRHAFVLRPADAAIPDDATLLSAREARTGRIFGRLRLGPPRPADPRLDRLAASLAVLRAALPPPNERRLIPIRAGFAAAGALLACPSDGRSGAAARALARAHPALTRPTPRAAPADPRGTVVLWSRRSDAAATAAAALRPVAPGPLADLFIADAGDDARTRLLPALCPDATFLHRPGGLALDAACWRAANEARGACLVVIDGDAGPVPATIIRGIIDRFAPECVVASRAIAGMVSAVGKPADREIPVTSGFLLAVDRALFLRVGGLDPAVSGDAALAVADFCLRAALLGARTVWPAGPAPVAASEREMPAPAAVAVFRERWGQLAGAARP